MTATSWTDQSAGLHIRPLCPDDEDVIAALLSDEDVLAQVSPDTKKHMQTIDVPVMVTREWLRGEGRSVELALVRDNTTAGWVSLNADDDEGAVWDVSVNVLETARGSGVGRSGVQLALDLLRRERPKATSAQADIRSSNGASLALFRSLGFELVGHQAEFLSVGRYELNLRNSHTDAAQ